MNRDLSALGKMIIVLGLILFGLWCLFSILNQEAHGQPVTTITHVSFSATDPTYTGAQKTAHLNTATGVVFRWYNSKWNIETIEAVINHVKGIATSNGAFPVHQSLLSLLQSNQFALSRVLSFHSGQFLGGGEFYPSKINKLDYINCFRSLTDTSMYWHRLDRKPCLDWIDFGATGQGKKLTEYAYTQIHVNALYDPSYGITVNDNDDYAGYQTVLLAAEKKYVCMFNTPLKAHVNRTVRESRKIYEFEQTWRYFNGSVLTYRNETGPITYLQKRVINQNDAIGPSGQVGSQPFIQGVIINGKNDGSIGIEYEGSYGAVIQSSRFNDISYGLIYRFGLMSCARNNMYSNNKEYACLATYGDRWGGTNYDSQSNHFRSEQQRFYGAQKGKVHLGIIAASGTQTIQNIFEGYAPDTACYLFDSKGSAVVKEFLADGNHVECPDMVNGVPYNYTAFKLRLAGGTGKIRGVYHQYNCTLVDASQPYGGYPHLYVEDLAWLTPSTKFKGSSVVWSFNETPNGENIINSKWWIQDGSRIVPYYSFQEYFNQDKVLNGLPSMRIGNQSINPAPLTY